MADQGAQRQIMTQKPPEPGREIASEDAIASREHFDNLHKQAQERISANQPSHQIGAKP